jgi:hypothetical protein
VPGGKLVFHMEFSTQELLEICDFTEKLAHCLYHRRYYDNKTEKVEMKPGYT